MIYIRSYCQCIEYVIRIEKNKTRKPRRYTKTAHEHRSSVRLYRTCRKQIQFAADLYFV